jgi:MYXO-CTERM domain-containing protein|nr:glycoside hydrolase family 15 protein [Kofleriaceae bacterium]
MRIGRTSLASAFVLALVASPAAAIQPVASFPYLVTGNGFGFQVYDSSANAIKQYLEHPYRYLHENPSDPSGEGIVRRNLVFDTYFGVQVGSTATWLSSKAPAQYGYVNESNVIRSEVPVSGVDTETFFTAPFGYPGNGMLMVLKVTNTGSAPVTVTGFSIHNFHMGSAPNPDTPGADGESIAYDAASQSTTETGPGGGTMVYIPVGGVDASSCASNVYNTVAAGTGITMTPTCNGTDIVNAFSRSLGSIAPGASASWGVAVLFADDGNAGTARAAWSTFAGTQTADQLLAGILAEQESARQPPVGGLSASETSIWRQAETTLRMAQIQEPWSDSEPPRHKNTGMILASLPPGEWHTGWVRDAQYAIAALSRTGHGDRAKAGLNFFLNADSGRFGSYVANQPYRVSLVRYYGDGEEEIDYSGQPTPNVEIDGWGLFMWSARTYVDASGDVGWLTETTKSGDTVYDAIKNGVAEPLIANLEPTGMAMADTSIWEVHWGDRQHFTYTTAAAARGLCDMATLAKRAGKPDDVTRYKMYAAKVQAALTANFADSQHVLAGSLEKLATGGNYHDGSTIEAITWSLVGGSDPVASATLNGLSNLVTPAGGYKRLEGSTDQYDTDEWILIDLRASAAWRRAGNTGQADSLLNWVTAQASVNNNLLPELYNAQSSGGPIGAYSGSIPMVGYGAGAYQMTLLDRAGQTEHTDCGDFDLNMEPDAGAVTGGGGGGGDGGTGIDPGRTGVACACSSGQGAPGNLIVFAIAGLLVWRRRRV